MSNRLQDRRNFLPNGQLERDTRQDELLQDDKPDPENFSYKSQWILTCLVALFCIASIVFLIILQVQVSNLKDRVEALNTQIEEAEGSLDLLQLGVMDNGVQVIDLMEMDDQQSDFQGINKESSAYQ